MNAVWYVCCCLRTYFGSEMWDSSSWTSWIWCSFSKHSCASAASCSRSQASSSSVTCHRISHAKHGQGCQSPVVAPMFHPQQYSIVYPTWAKDCKDGMAEARIECFNMLRLKCPDVLTRDGCHLISGIWTQSRFQGWDKSPQNMEWVDPGTYRYPTPHARKVQKSAWLIIYIYILYLYLYTYIYIYIYVDTWG